MTVPSRVALVKADKLPSSYQKKNSQERFDVSSFKDRAYITPDMFAALRKLEELVRLNGGTLYITDLFRTWEDQESARSDYETGKKKAYVAKPGESFHMAGRGVDFSVQELNFKNVDKDDWLSFFWNLAKPLGFHPIIKIPDLKASEAWHFDYLGKDWEDVYNKLLYKEVAKCCILDIGKWNPKEGNEKIVCMFIQAQLIRLGHYDIGTVDGVIGPKTRKILDFLGFKDWDNATIATMLAGRNKNGG